MGNASDYRIPATRHPIEAATPDVAEIATNVMPVADRLTTEPPMMPPPPFGTKVTSPTLDVVLNGIGNVTVIAADCQRPLYPVPSQLSAGTEESLAGKSQKPDTCSKQAAVDLLRLLSKAA
jgi:hypothetical protein